MRCRRHSRRRHSSRTDDAFVATFLPLENPISSLRANAIRFVSVIFLYAHAHVIAQRFFSGKRRRRSLPQASTSTCSTNTQSASVNN
jgi:hypothetical protein